MARSTSIPPPLAPRPYPIVTQESLLSRCEYFVEVQLWPLNRRLHAESWLANFLPAELEHALHLLNIFQYFSAQLVERLFMGAFQGMSRHVVTSKNAFMSARSEWRRFISTALIVRVTGERPSEADSGHLFVRLARDRFHVPEENLADHSSALSRLLTDPSTPIVFVDDFVGSGNQFVTMWCRKYEVPNRPSTLSFADAVSLTRTRSIFYCPVLCTQSGLTRIVHRCPQVTVVPAHLLSNQYNVLAPDSLLWPDHLRANAYGFVEAASKRAGIPDNGGNVGDWRGFKKLGLAIAFEHGIPDATLPLFTWTSNNWKPLLRSDA